MLFRSAELQDGRAADANRDAFPATVISRHPDLSYFHKILTPELINFLNNTPTLTVFLPVDDAWNVLHPLERLYLESEFASDDLTRIFNMHAVLLKDKKVKWSDSFETPTECTLSAVRARQEANPSPSADH